MTTTENLAVQQSTRSDCMRFPISEVLKAIAFSAETRNPLVLWGVKAVGKTSIIKKYCEDNNYRIVVLHLASQGVEDLVGLMSRSLDDEDQVYMNRLLEKVNKNKDLTSSEYEWVRTMSASSSGKQKTVWTRPNWLTNDVDNPTCYFLDEMNRANKFVMACMLPFLNEGKMHEHQIGPKDFIVAACNPSNGKYQVNDAFSMDEALKDRCGHIIVEPTKEEFYAYASEYFDETTMKVVQKHSNFVNLAEFDLNFRVEPSRRSLVNIMQHLKDKDRNWIRENGRAVIGTYLGGSFLNIWWNEKFRSDEYFTLDELKSCKSKEEKIKHRLVTYIDGGVESVRMDLLDAAIDTMIDWIREEYKDGVSTVTWLIDFFKMQFIPKDIMVAFITRINLWEYPSLCEEFFDSGIFKGEDRFNDQYAICEK